MNPFEEFLTQTSENEMTRSQSFDLSDSGSSLFQQQTQIASVASAIGYDPSRMGTFLGHHVPYNKPGQKLETIHENVPTSTQNCSSQMPSSFHWNQNKEQQLSEKKIVSVRGSISSWNL